MSLENFNVLNEEGLESVRAESESGLEEVLSWPIDARIDEPTRSVAVVLKGDTGYEARCYVAGINESWSLVTSRSGMNEKHAFLFASDPQSFSFDD